jgi:hypothetical protein
MKDLISHTLVPAYGSLGLQDPTKVALGLPCIVPPFHRLADGQVLNIDRSKQAACGTGMEIL